MASIAAIMARLSTLTAASSPSIQFLVTRILKVRIEMMIGKLRMAIRTPLLFALPAMADNNDNEAAKPKDDSTSVATKIWVF